MKKLEFRIHDFAGTETDDEKANMMFGWSDEVAALVSELASEKTERDELGEAVYIVTQEGNYRHDILGVYSSMSLARAAAVKAIDAETDDYHDYEISRAKIDELCVAEGVGRYEKKVKTISYREYEKAIKDPPAIDHRKMFDGDWSQADEKG